MNSTIQKITALSFLLLSTPSFAASLEASDPGCAPFVAVSRPEPVTGSIPAQNRTRLLDALHDYAIAGNFPQNVDTPDGRQLYFLDADGRPCAVAHLMIVSGRLADVQAIAATNNAVKVLPSTGGAIADWIRTSGFTVREIMMIQEPDGYGYVGPGSVDPVGVANADRERIQRRLLSVERRLRAAGIRTAPGLSAS